MYFSKREIIGVLAGLGLGIVLGFFAGQEYFKYKLEQNLAYVSGQIGGMLGNSIKASKIAPAKMGDREEDYLKFLELFDVHAGYRPSFSEERVPGIDFKIRNKGDKTIDEVTVTIYFKDATGKRIAEEQFRPISALSFEPNHGPLKPGYVWEMEPGQFYRPKLAPRGWQDANADAEISSIHFAD